jgi:hypothetical protein
MVDEEVIEKSYWVTFRNKDNIEYIEKEVKKAAIELYMDVQTFRAWIFKAFVYDPEVRAKVIEYIKKNEQGTNQ